MRVEPGEECRGARAWLSAHRDGEVADDGVLAVHVAGCDGCRTWAAVSDDVTRRSRVRAAGSPDVVAAALSQWRRQAPGSAAHPRQTAVGRWLLGLAAALGIALAAIGMLDASAGATADVHAGLDLLALEGALAVGFAVASFRPERYSAALLPVVAVATLLTVIPSGAAVSAGSLDAVAEVSHVSVWLGLTGLLLVLDARRGPRPRSRPPIRPGTPRLS